MSLLSSIISKRGFAASKVRSASIPDNSVATSSGVIFCSVATVVSEMCLMGSSTVNTDPSLSALFTEIVPPCSSTNAFTSERPMPDPLGCIRSAW